MLGRPETLRLRRHVVAVEFDAVADLHLYPVAVVRWVVPLKLEADRAVTAEDAVCVRNRGIVHYVSRGRLRRRSCELGQAPVRRP